MQKRIERSDRILYKSGCGTRKGFVFFYKKIPFINMNLDLNHGQNCE